MSSALSLQAVSKSFFLAGQQIKALDTVSMAIRTRRVTGLIGPDGAGKTSLMRLACGLLLPEQGTITVLGMDVAAQPLAVQSAVGYMPQRFGLYEDLSVQENLDLYADLHGVAPQQRPARFQELLHMTGLSPFTRRLAGRLSGGMKQKLGLACTLVRRPRLLLLDEPTVGVDPVSRRELWEIVYRAVKDEGMSVLLSTAYLDEAERCDEVVLIHRGRVLGQGAPASFSQPLQGRTFQLSVPEMSKRSLQARLSANPTLVDALIVGDSVRIITLADHPPTAEGLLPGISGVHISQVPPRFEDAFISRLKGPQQAVQRPDVFRRGEASAPTDERVISVQKLQRHFGDFQAVKGISFEVRRGEIFGLLGANGAGKSTTFRILCGLLPASGGQVAVAGYDLRRAAAMARRRIGYMAQRFSLYENITVDQNLRFFASAYGLRGRQQQERIRWALEVFELEPYRDSDSGDLPLGYKQRLAFAAALMHEPEILFLDEPTSGVDPLARREFWQRTNALAEAGVTILVTTHFMEEANYCDRLVIMAEGEVLATGTPEEMKARVRSAELPAPTMEDTFIALIEKQVQD